MQSSAGVGANLPDAEAYASAAGFDFGAGRNSSLEAPRPLLRGGSFSRGFALPMHGPGMISTLHTFYMWLLFMCTSHYARPMCIWYRLLYNFHSATFHTTIDTKLLVSKSRAPHSPTVQLMHTFAHACVITCTFPRVLHMQHSDVLY